MQANNPFGNRQAKTRGWMASLADLGAAFRGHFRPIPEPLPPAPWLGPICGRDRSELLARHTQGPAGGDRSPPAGVLPGRAAPRRSGHRLYCGYFRTVTFLASTKRLPANFTCVKYTPRATRWP